MVMIMNKTLILSANNGNKNLHNPLINHRLNQKKSRNQLIKSENLVLLVLTTPR